MKYDVERKQPHINRTTGETVFSGSMQVSERIKIQSMFREKFENTGKFCQKTDSFPASNGERTELSQARATWTQGWPVMKADLGTLASQRV